MRRLRFLSILVLLMVALSSKMGTAITAQDDNLVENKVIFSIPIGSGLDDIGYEGLGKEEVLAWGPTALDIGEDGSFYIVDGANHRVQHYHPSGSLLSSIAFDSTIVGVSDIEATEDALFVLDVAAMKPVVHRLAMDGTLVQSYYIPKILEGEVLWENVNGIRIGIQGEVYIEHGLETLQLTAPTGDRLADPHNTVGFQDSEGKRYEIRLADWAEDPRTGEILVYGLAGGNPQQIKVQVSHTLGGLRYLQSYVEGFFVLVEEIFYDGTIHVDQTIRHYDSNGNLVGIARTPLNDFYVPVENGIVVGPDGDVYALVTKRDWVEVQRLTFIPLPEPIFPDREPVVAPMSAPTDPGNPTSTLGCRSRSTMMQVCANYHDNYRWLSSTNTDGACIYRAKPRYIGGQGYYSSVPYDAGGWDTVSNYNSRMAAGDQAGDISWDEDPNTPGNQNCCATCSRGVDCSGFVTHVWGEIQKLYTSTIPEYSYQLSSVNDLIIGDVLNKPSDHVAVFVSVCSGGAQVYHSTTYNSYDRVINRCHVWSYFNGYSPRRYNNVCP